MTASFLVRPQNHRGIESDPHLPISVLFFFFQNAAGHFYSRSYGFGVLNANSLIKKAKEWRHVPQQLSYELPGTLTRDSAVIPSRRETVLKVTSFNVLLLICSFL